MTTNIDKVDCLQTGSIDSLKLRFELNNLDFYDERLSENLTVIDSDGNIDSEYKRKSKNYLKDNPDKNYSIYASISENVRVSKDKFTDCLTVLINSKQTGSNYFKGINKQTIKVIYKLLIDNKVFACSFDTFLNGIPTDIDIKKDYEMEMDEYKEMISVCELMTKPSSNRDKGCTTFKTATNYGIAWSVRTTSKYKTSPYTKVYHKGIEFSIPKSNGGSKEFKDCYLPNTNTSNVIRIETTIKNKSHLFKLDLGFKKYNLNELLNLKQVDLDFILSTAVNAHLSPRNKSMSFKPKQSMSPSNRIYLNSLLTLTADHNYSIDRATNTLLNGIESKVSKSRRKSVLTELYTDHIKGTNYEAKSTKIDSIFDSLGWV